MSNQNFEPARIGKDRHQNPELLVLHEEWALK
jgi:hypothetical protein